MDSVLTGSLNKMLNVNNNSNNYYEEPGNIEGPWRDPYTFKTSIFIPHHLLTTKIQAFPWFQGFRCIIEIDVKTLQITPHLPPRNQVITAKNALANRAQREQTKKGIMFANKWVKRKQCAWSEIEGKYTHKNGNRAMYQSSDSHFVLMLCL